jgi:alkaline phosphatase D
MNSLQMTRRQLIKALSLSTLILPFGNIAWAEKKFEKNPFSLGVASGSPGAQSIVLWTRLIDDQLASPNLHSEPIAVKWELAEDSQFKKMIQSGVSLAVPALAYSVHVEVNGLPSNQWFFYRFQTGNVVSDVGRTRTLPAPNDLVDKLRMSYASCQNYEHGHFSAYKHMRDEKLDLVMFLGDYIYEYGPGRRGVRSHNSGPLSSLEDYRSRYVLYKKDENLKAMHAACPWLMTWDDHEVQNDYAGLNPGSSKMGISEFTQMRASAYQAYYEHLPLPSSALIDGIDGLMRGAEMRLYGNFSYGRLVNISILDDRQYRDPAVCTPSGSGSAVVDPSACAELGSPERTLLGFNQEKWLSKVLKNADKNRWNVIGQPTLYSQRYFPRGDNLLVWNDGWDGYPSARSRLNQEFINNQVKNLVIFGGDIHENWVGYLKRDYNNADSQVIGIEFCGTSITSMGNGSKSIKQRLQANPHFIFAEATRKGYGVAEFTPKELIVTLRVVSNAGDEESTIESLAKFRVQSQSNRIEII